MMFSSLVFTAGDVLPSFLEAKKGVICVYDNESGLKPTESLFLPVYIRG